MEVWGRVPWTVTFKLRLDSEDNESARPGSSGSGWGEVGWKKHSKKTEKHCKDPEMCLETSTEQRPAWALLGWGSAQSTLSSLRMVLAVSRYRMEFSKCGGMKMNGSHCLHWEWHPAQLHATEWSAVRLEWTVRHGPDHIRPLFPLGMCFAARKRISRKSDLHKYEPICHIKRAGGELSRVAQQCYYSLFSPLCYQYHSDLFLCQVLIPDKWRV